MMNFSFFTVSGAKPEQMLKQQDPTPEIQGGGGSPLWILLLIVGGYVCWPTSPPVTEIPSPPSYIIPADVQDMFVPDVLALGEVLREVGKWPDFVAAFDGDDLTKLSKIMNNPAILLSDLEALQWALNALNTLEGEVAELLRAKICEAVPRLCGGAVSSTVVLSGNDFLDIPLGDTEVSVRAYNAIMSYYENGKRIRFTNLRTFLEKISFSDFPKFRNVGKSTLVEVKELLRKGGYDWENEKWIE